MPLYFTLRFYLVAAILVLLFIISFFFPPLFIVTKVLTGLWVLAVVVDLALLFITRAKPNAERACSDRFSNGDENEVKIEFCNPYSFKSRVEVIDEMPVEFQMRDFVMKDHLKAKQQHTISYSLTPKKRGVYHFDRIRLFFSSPIGLVQRRFTCGTPFSVKVYPSYTHLSLYSLIAIHNKLDEVGIKRVRQVGADTEYDQIKDYVQGDDYRNINWKASARAYSLKVNVYQQERSQNLYAVIDKGRMMQQTFNGMTFFEYAVNASLAISYVAMKKDDRSGLISFAKEVDGFVPAAKQGGQMQCLMEQLYHEQTIFSESDYSGLSSFLAAKVTKRSLVILFANFATLNQLKRELQYLRQISRQHKLIVVIFKDRQMHEFVELSPKNTEEYYQQIMVEQYIEEKDHIERTLRQNGIITLQTYPENLSINIINKYLEVRRF